jgi:cyclophilin family peptidyl-prolyl cis-trans isomerase/HEAT repeat protein
MPGAGLVAGLEAALKRHVSVFVIAFLAAAGRPPLAAALAPDNARAQVLQLADERRWDARAIGELSGSDDARVRVAVAEMVSELANENGCAVLAGLASDAVPTVRAAAVEGSGRLCAALGHEASACRALGKLVARRLADPAPEVRRAAAWAIGDGFVARGRAMIARLAKERSAAVRATILGELWRLGGDAWTARAERALSAPAAAERYAAAWSLGRAAKRAAEAALLARAGDGDASVRTAILEAGRRIDPSAFRDAFFAALADDDVRVRTAALMGLQAAGVGSTPVRPDALARIAALVADDAFPDVQQRVAAIGAAGALGMASRELEKVLAASDGWLGGEALVALARERAPSAAGRVSSWLRADDPDRRAAAVRAARYLSGGASLVEGALRDASVPVRLAAIEASDVLVPERRVAALDALLDDADPAVRASAMEALDKAGARPRLERLLALLAKENGQALPDAAVALTDAIAASRPLTTAARAALVRLAGGGGPVVARAAWAALRRAGVRLPLPTVQTGMDLAGYRAVVAWAEQPEWLEVRTWRGTMLVSLDTVSAPLIAWRIAKLAAAHYFDGLTIHRVVPNFVAQGGDPRGDGWGGPGFALRDELSLAPFGAGDVGLALAGPDTGGSQLFVTLTPQLHLVGRYPHVGRVVEGVDVAARLRVGDRILRIRAGSGPLPAYLPVWYGRLDAARLDAGIPGWKAEGEGYKPRSDLLATLAGAKVRYELHVAMGTWCSDSHDQVPRLEKIVAALGGRSPFAPPILVGVDRSKATRPSEWAYGKIELVPTIVVTAGGAEIGRIVESPSSGSIEEDLVRILAPVEGWNMPAPRPTSPP